MKKETNLYHKLKDYFQGLGFFYLRLEAPAVPDIFVCRNKIFHYIEVKVGPNPAYQFGQKAFLYKINKHSPGAGLLCKDNYGILEWYVVTNTIYELDKNYLPKSL